MCFAFNLIAYFHFLLEILSKNKYWCISLNISLLMFGTLYWRCSRGKSLKSSSMCTSDPRTCDVKILWSNCIFISNDCKSGTRDSPSDSNSSLIVNGCPIIRGQSPYCPQNIKGCRQDHMLNLELWILMPNILRLGLTLETLFLSNSYCHCQ